MRFYKILSVIPDGHDSANDADGGGLAPPSQGRRSSIVAWMPHDADPNLSRPTSGRRNSVMATYLNKLVALPYTDDAPVKERTRVDAVVPFNDPKTKKDLLDVR